MPEHGHFRGTATDGHNPFLAEALLTVDGEVRIAIFGPNDGMGALSGAGLWDDDLEPSQSSQFIGRVEAANGHQASGTGIVIGQICAAAAAGRFCGEPAQAEFSLEAVPEHDLSGEIRITTPSGAQTWAFDLHDWSAYYGLNAMPMSIGGSYVEMLAEFATPGDVVISFDNTDRWFFQSATTGCVGNGSVEPHADGRYYVYDVALDIGNCSLDYAHLNTSLSGLATFTQNNYWGYDDWLVVFLSTPGESSPAAAVTLYAVHQ